MRPCASLSCAPPQKARRSCSAETVAMRLKLRNATIPKWAQKPTAPTVVGHVSARRWQPFANCGSCILGLLLVRPVSAACASTASCNWTTSTGELDNFAVFCAKIATLGLATFATAPKRSPKLSLTLRGRILEIKVRVRYKWISGT